MDNDIYRILKTKKENGSSYSITTFKYIYLCIKPENHNNLELNIMFPFLY